ncbi:MAG: hypothetical protein ABJN26_21635 [Stappiaceae bacterium]
MVSGRQTMASIDEAMRGLAREENDLRQRLEALTRKVSELQANEADSYRELARFRLEDNASEAVTGRLDKAGREARRIIAERVLLIEELHHQQKTAQASLEAIERNRADLVDRREQEAAELENILDAVDDKLSDDPTYLSKKDETEQALMTAQAAREKADQAAADRDEKAAAYEQDSLFMYLWNRKYGTSEYNCRGLIRALDNKVASLVGYSAARPNYKMLTEIPVRLDEHANRLLEESRGLAQTLADISRSAATEAAGRDLVHEIEKIDQQINVQAQERDTLESSLKALEKKSQSMAEGTDPAFKQASDALLASLQQETVRKLLRDAIDTPSDEDDAIVRKIITISDDISQVEGESRQYRDELHDVSKRRTELAKVTDQFRRNQYDDYGSDFRDDGLAGVVLGELLKGAITGADYWSRAQKSHRRRRPQGRRKAAFPGGIGLPESLGGAFPSAKGGFPDFGGMTRGGMSSGKRRPQKTGGDGFRTGDSF